MRHVGHGRMIEQIDNAPWRERVLWSAVAAMPTPEPFAGPLHVVASFTFALPKSAPKRRRIWPVTRSTGDADKHARLLLDALQDAGVMRDDAQVVRLMVSKLYMGDPIALSRPGARVAIWQVTT